MTNSTKFRGLALTLPLLFVASQGAIAQSAGEGAGGGPASNDSLQKAGSRTAGARVGAFTVNIDGDVNVVDDTNVYATTTGPLGDVYLRVSPRLSAKTENSVYKFNLSGGVTRYQYAKYKDENRTDWNVNSSLQLEPLHATFLRLQATHSKSHEERGDPNASGSAVTTTPYTTTQGQVALAREVGKLKANLEGKFVRLNYENVATVGGGRVPNDERDRKQIGISGRLSYKISQGYSIVVRGGYDSITYRIPVDSTGINRDSTGLRGTAGLYFGLTNLLDGEIFGGFVNRKYKFAGLTSYSAPVYGASLIWSPARSTKVRLAADRRLEETVSRGFKQYQMTSYELSVDRDFSPTLSGTISGRYAQNTYLGLNSTVTSQRSDDNFGFDAAVKKNLGSHLTLAASYGWNKRNSQAANATYAKHRAEVSLAAKF